MMLGSREGPNVWPFGSARRQDVGSQLKPRSKNWNRPLRTSASVRRSWRTTAYDPHTVTPIIATRTTKSANAPRRRRKTVKAAPVAAIASRIVRILGQLEEDVLELPRFQERTHIP